VKLLEKHAVRLHVEQEIASLEARVAEGRELLEAGFAREAVREFRLCVDAETLCVPAWEGLAAAHQRLGHEEESESCRQMAQCICESLECRRIEAAVRAERRLQRR